MPVGDLARDKRPFDINLEPLPEFVVFSKCASAAIDLGSVDSKLCPLLALQISLFVSIASGKHRPEGREILKLTQKLIPHQPPPLTGMTSCDYA